MMLFYMSQLDQNNPPAATNKKLGFNHAHVPQHVRTDVPNRNSTTSFQGLTYAQPQNIIAIALCREGETRLILVL